MFDGLFSKAFYGNSILEWSITLGLIIASVVLAKFIYILIGGSVKKLTKKTKNEFDDLVVDMIEEPFVFALIIIGIWYSLQTLNLHPVAEALIAKAYYVLIIFNIAWTVTRLIDAIIQKYVLPLVKDSDSKLDDQLIPVVRKGIKVSIWIIAILVALNNAGYDVGAVLASLGIGGLAFALAAKDTIANLFGSFTIFVDKPFTIGDRVILQGYDGFVEEIGLRSTRLRTLTGRMITLANSTVADSSIENVTSEPSRKITLHLGLTYDTDETQIEHALELLKTIAQSNESVLENYSVAFTAFNDFALNVRFIYYIEKGASIGDVQTAINLQILKQFNANKLEFAFPTQTIYTNPA
ncbi:MAG: mechanosensitive ion channel family protein [Campylobacterota bacterium]|nr:mechanosensitive ion channel family protein [Campylobacterota bacterium]